MLPPLSLHWTKGTKEDSPFAILVQNHLPRVLVIPDIYIVGRTYCLDRPIDDNHLNAIGRTKWWRHNYSLPSWWCDWMIWSITTKSSAVIFFPSRIHLISHQIKQSTMYLIAPDDKTQSRCWKNRLDSFKVKLKGYFQHSNQVCSSRMPLVASTAAIVPHWP